MVKSPTFVGGAQSDGKENEKEDHRNYLSPTGEGRDDALPSLPSCVPLATLKVNHFR